MKRSLQNSGGLLVLTMVVYLGQIFSVYGQMDIYWRSEASNGYWSVGSNPCAEIGSNASQWWYPLWSTNEARNTPDCFGIHRIVINNNHELVMNNNISFVDINGIIFEPGADQDRIIEGEAIDLRFSTSLAKIENYSIATHHLASTIALHASPTEFNPINGNLVFFAPIYNNGNFIDVYGDNGNNLEILGDIVGNGGVALKQNTTIIMQNNKSYSGPTILEAGTLELRGSLFSSAVTVSNGATLRISGNAVTVASLSINEGGIVEIEPGKVLTVTGALINNATASGLIIKSDATGTGSLIHNTADVPATVERYFAGAEQWRLVSSPVVNQAVSGEWTPAGTYQPDNTGYDFYAYDEPTYTWLNQKVGENNINNFVPGKGYLVSFEAANQTKLFTDDLNYGDVIVAVTKTGTGAYAGANLIGNPYASGIDWNLATRTLFADDYAYVYDPTAGGGAGGYVTVDGGQTNAFIAPHQGFIVLANASGNYTFDNSLRVHGGTYTKNSGSDGLLTLTLNNDTYYDLTTLRTLDIADFIRDRSDAIKMYSFNPAAPQLYSYTSDQKKVAINSIPSIPEQGSIALGLLVPETGFYTLSLAEISGEFDTDYVYLEDLLAGITQNLAENPVYSFHADKGEANNRFLLKFGALSVPELPGSIQLHAYTHGNTLFVMSQHEKALVEVYNVQGQLVLSHAIGQGLQSMQTALAPGAYIVRMISDNETATHKVIIQ
jgi:hypothetical protein